ncbi:hypothetical protein DPEC_G00343010 [Dallia pectoralis]|uniref:Uncharacterized protein n=1 Tax=Dallia pectoralis TaxID=75939 RepID=A0ACC2F2V1_DALPE|nr:hypothetical protein DPEC_G00343010 [Dallia pectoralis]
MWLNEPCEHPLSSRICPWDAVADKAGSVGIWRGEKFDLVYFVFQSLLHPAFLQERPIAESLLHPAILQENPIAEPHHPEEDMPLITNFTREQITARTYFENLNFSERISMDVPPRDLGKMAHRCPICNLKYANLVQHLKLGEQVCNRTELDLLCKMAHRHFTAPLDCPVHSCESIQLTRLDKHLSRVHNLQSEMVTLYMQTAKDRYIARELALLRASRPHPPMVSHIDESAAEPSGSSSFCSLTSRRLFRRNRPVPRTPSVGCENCQTLAAELKVVRGLLETEIDRNEELKQLHMTTSRDTAVRYRRQKPLSVSKAPQYVKLVEDFKEHTEGTNPSKKVKENARQRANHVIKFLEFMSKPAVPHLNLLFLKDYSRVRK